MNIEKIGNIPSDTIEETLKRLKDRKVIREDNIRKLNEGRWLEANTSEQLQKRLEQLNISQESPEFLRLLERIIGQNNLQDISFVKLCLWMGRTVGRISFQASSGATRATGTGFRVSPRLLLTNNHVLFSPSEASSSLVEFNFEHAAGPQQVPVTLCALEPDVFFLTDKRLDYTLVAISEDTIKGAALDSSRFVRLSEATDTTLVGEPVNIIHHPDGLPKQLTLRDNRLVDIVDDFVHYEADTEGGSSGSPTFNEQWDVVALHHSGVPKTDDQDRPLSKSGIPWTEDMGESQIDWAFNEGVRISSILANVKAQNLATENEKTLRDEIFTKRPPLPPVTFGTVSP